MIEPEISREAVIVLDPRRFGYEAWEGAHFRRLSEAVEQMNGRLRQTLGAVAAIHKPSWPPPQDYLNSFNGIQVSVRKVGEGVALVLDNLPDSCLQKSMDGTAIPRRGQHLLSTVLADAVRSDWTVKERMHYAGLLEQKHGARYRTFIQGGHKVPPEEYHFSKGVGFSLGEWFQGDLELTTGCGPGVMEGPFKGLFQSYTSNAGPLHRRVGLTEIGILAKEAPNGALSDLVTFPNIEERMEAFIRSAQFGIALRGGAGTMEEILVFAGLMTHADNQGQEYPFYLLEPSDGQNYFSTIKKFLEKTASAQVSNLFTWQAGTPQECVRRIQLSPSLKERCVSGYWNDALVIPGDFLRPFEASRNDFEELVLSRDRDVPGFLCDLRRLFSGLVTVTVKKPDLFREYQRDRPRVHVDSAILSEIEAVLRMMQKEKRIPALPTREDGSFSLPFEFINP